MLNKTMLDKLADTYEKRLTVFVAAVLIYSMLYMIVPFVCLVEATPLSRVAYLAVFLGMCWLVFEGLLIRFVPGRTPLFGYIVAFGLCLITGTILNYQSELFGNLKSTVFEISLLLVFFTAGAVLHKDNRMDLFGKKLQSVALVVWTIACFVSLAMFVLQYSDVVSIPGSDLVRRQGYMEGRLFGIFQDPNYAAVFSLLIIVATLHYLAKDKVRYREATVIALALNALYMVGADSRTAYVCVGLVLVCYLIVIAINKANALAIKLRQALKAVALFAAIALLVTFVSAAMGCYSELIQGFVGQSDGGALSSGRRTDAGIDNISNNRFEIWMSYLGAVDSESFLFGRGYRGYTDQVTELYPFSYIASSQYEAHNGYVLLLMSTGIVGLAIWAVLLARVGSSVFLAARNGLVDPIGAVFLMSVFAILLAKAFFFTSLWFVNEFDAYLFVLLLGYSWERCSSCRLHPCSSK